MLNHQASDSDYKFSGWDRGHLTPANIALWSEKAGKSSFSFINIAPQEPFINEQPWERLENEVECFSEKHRTLVVTGICKNSLGKIKGKSLDIPSCFWKMICYKDENSVEQVVGFKADNSPIPAGKTDDREKEIFTAISQAEINKLYDSSLGNPWLKASAITSGREVGINPGFIDINNNPGTIWLPVNINDCRRALTLTDYEKEAWEEKLRGKRGKKRKRTRREAGNRFPRGCSSSRLDELEDLSDLMKKRQAAVGETEDDEDSSSNSADEDSPSGDVEVSVQKCGKRIIGYYTSWGLKKIDSRVMAKLTHIIYAFLEMRSDGTVDLGSPDVAHSTDVEKETQTSRERLEHLMNLAKFYPHVKIMFAVGGWENSQYFSKIAASSDSRIKFIASIVKLIEKYGNYYFNFCNL